MVNSPENALDREVEMMVESFSNGVHALTTKHPGFAKFVLTARDWIASTVRDSFCTPTKV